MFLQSDALKSSGPQVEGNREESASLRGEELLALRMGKPGIIRTNLTPEKVAAALNEQLMQFSPRDISGVISFFSPHLEQHARYVLHTISGFACLESLGAIVSPLESDLLFTGLPGSLAENVSYLASRKELFGAEHLIQCSEKLDLSNVVLLDHSTLECLSSDPSFGEQLAARPSLKLMNPRGFVAGVNMFNVVTTAELKEKTAEILSFALQIQHDSPKTIAFEDAVRLALDAPLLRALAATGDRCQHLLSIVHDVEPGYLKRSSGREERSIVTMPACVPLSGRKGLDSLEGGEIMALVTRTNQQPARSVWETPVLEEKLTFFDDKDICQRLNGLCGISPHSVSEVLGSIPKGFADLACELVLQNSQVYSARRMAHELRALRGRIETEANKQGIGPEKILFVIPNANKSYAMVTMAYCLANKCSFGRIVTCDELKKREKGAFGVALDDLSGSGQTLQTAANKFRGSKQKFLGAALVATPGALKAYHGIAGTIIPTFRDSQLRSQADGSLSDILDLMLGHKGHHDNALCVTFPYMGPDNCNALWSRHFAPHFSISTKSIRRYSYYRQPTIESVTEVLQPKLEAVFARVPHFLKGADSRFKDGMEIIRALDPLLKVADGLNLPFDNKAIGAMYRKLCRQCEEAVALVHKFISSKTRDISPKECFVFCKNSNALRAYVDHMTGKGENTALLKVGRGALTAIYDAREMIADRFHSALSTVFARGIKTAEELENTLQLLSSLTELEGNGKSKVTASEQLEWMLKVKLAAEALLGELKQYLGKGDADHVAAKGRAESLHKTLLMGCALFRQKARELPQAALPLIDSLLKTQKLTENFATFTLACANLAQIDFTKDIIEVFASVQREVRRALVAQELLNLKFPNAIKSALSPLNSWAPGFVAGLNFKRDDSLEDQLNAISTLERAQRAITTLRRYSGLSFSNVSTTLRTAHVAIDTCIKEKTAALLSEISSKKNRSLSDDEVAQLEKLIGGNRLGPNERRIIDGVLTANVRASISRAQKIICAAIERRDRNALLEASDVCEKALWLCKALSYGGPPPAARSASQTIQALSQYERELELLRELPSPKERMGRLYYLVAVKLEPLTKALSSMGVPQAIIEAEYLKLKQAFFSEFRAHLAAELQTRLPFPSDTLRQGYLNLFTKEETLSRLKPSENRFVRFPYRFFALWSDSLANATSSPVSFAEQSIILGILAEVCIGLGARDYLKCKDQALIKFADTLSAACQTQQNLISQFGGGFYRPLFALQPPELFLKAMEPLGFNRHGEYTPVANGEKNTEEDKARFSLLRKGVKQVLTRASSLSGLTFHFRTKTSGA